METSKLRKFASYARKSLIEQVGTRMKSVLAGESLARRESPKAVADLEAKIEELGRGRTIEMVAYTWFNRFCALRYMDVNRYTKIGIVSPAEGQFQPEILAEAKMGHVDEELVPAATREKVMRLLDETDPSDDPQGEAYRLLLVAVCNYYHGLMPFMFEKIADFTELLLPDDLLSGNSILAYTREALLPVNCSPEHTEEAVEVIGWLYQFYIADKKADVFAALKKGKKITPENIPAATQLFTPHWIVRYLVENSLGRLWMLNHPESKLVERMDYYIKPEEVDSEQWSVNSRERDGSSELSRVDRLAEVDGRGRADLSGDKEVPERGNLRTNESDSASSSIDPIQHRGGTSAQEHGGVQELFIDCAGLEGRSGNSVDDRSSAGVRNSRRGHADSELAGGNFSHVDITSAKTDHSPLTTDHLRISSPEEIRICDPACGSRHMLTYAFDLLYTIYEEQGYQATDIPRLILTHNLYGIEIDQRAGALAAFALTMKAREKYRRFLTGGRVVQPNICVLENISIEKEEYDNYLHAHEGASGLWGFCRRVTPVVFEHATENQPCLPTLNQILEHCDYTKQAMQLADTLIRKRRYFTSKTRKMLRRNKTLRKKLFLALRSGSPLAECSDPTVTSHFQRQFQKAALAGEVLQYQDSIELTALVADFYFHLFNQYREADNFGSLIRPLVTDVSDVLEFLRERQMGEDLFLAGVHQQVLSALRQADYLSPKYHVVVANPPYMGRRNGMNDSLKAFINMHMPHCKADLYAAFLQVSIFLCVEGGFPALVTMQSWMFLSSYKGIREEIVRNQQIVALAHLGPRAFDEISGEVVQVAATVLRRAQPKVETRPVFVRLVDGDAEDKRNKFTSGEDRFTVNRQRNFEQISDCPLAYWLPHKVLQLFSEADSLEDHSDQRQGLATGDDDSFLRLWHEVSHAETNWNAESFPDDILKWYPFLKGGSFRKWHGNNEHCILFNSRAFKALSQQGNCLPSRDFYLRESLVWSDVTSCAFGARFNDAGKVFATGALSAFPKNSSRSQYILGFMNCIVHNEIMAALSSGIHYSVGYVDKSPLIVDEDRVSTITELVACAVEISGADWDSREVSWDFSRHPLIDENGRLSTASAMLETSSSKRTTTLLQLEQTINTEFLEIYGLVGEYDTTVAKSEVSLDCNPAYRYGSDKSEPELEALLLADTMREFSSYAVGCMLGRYSLDKPGLILANAGESIEDYYRIVAEKGVVSGRGTVVSGQWTVNKGQPSPHRS